MSVTLAPSSPVAPPSGGVRVPSLQHDLPDDQTAQPIPGAAEALLPANEFPYCRVYGEQPLELPRRHLFLQVFFDLYSTGTRSLKILLE
jgi:hypothetical protein